MGTSDHFAVVYGRVTVHAL